MNSMLNLGKLTGSSSSKEPPAESTEKKDPKPSELPVSSPQKPIRKTFKTPQGIYHLLNEFVHQLPKQKQKLARERRDSIVKPSRISYITIKTNDGDDKEEKEDRENESPGNFLVNASDAIFIFKHQTRPVPPRDKLQYSNPGLRFKVNPTCHDFNRITQSKDRLESILGFSTGDLILHDPLRKFHNQFNRENCISAGSVTAVVWIPNVPNLFLAAYSTGNLFLFDKDKEDQTFVEPLIDVNSFSVYKHEGKYNPVARWHISRSAINDLSFSPDGKYLAVACQDGYLRVFEFKAERLLLAFRSYYGGFLCVTWSPDSEYLLTGGEDDLISLWSFQSRKLILRGRAHQSWVSRVAFDPWNCSGENYTFASAGQDTRLALWEFTKSAIPKPRLKSGKRRDTNSELPKVIPVDQEEEAFPIIVPAVLNSDVGFLEPVVIHRAATEPLSDVLFIKDCVVTSCWAGISKFWSRPSFAEKLIFPEEEEEETKEDKKEETKPKLKRTMSEEEEELLKKKELAKVKSNGPIKQNAQ